MLPSQGESKQERKKKKKEREEKKEKWRDRGIERWRDGETEGRRKEGRKGQSTPLQPPCLLENGLPALYFTLHQLLALFHSHQKLLLVF